MTSEEPLIGCVRLLNDISIIPKEGLTVPNLRVELYEGGNPDLAWMAAIFVLGELPWNQGEERKVEIRIMSSEFRNYVQKNLPILHVRHGGHTLGSLALEN